MELLEIKNLTKSFGGLRAVIEFDLTIDKGEIVGLIGPMEQVRARSSI